MTTEPNTKESVFDALKRISEELATVKAERDQMVETLKAACDRTWSDETPQQVASIAANAIHWRDCELTRLSGEQKGDA
jgi:hypothetical protein